jgi:hypothetical protein
MLQVSFAHAARSVEHFIEIAPELLQAEAPQPQAQPVVEQPAAPTPEPTQPAAQPDVLTEAYALQQVAEAHNSDAATYPVELWSNYENRPAA